MERSTWQQLHADQQQGAEISGDVWTNGARAGAVFRAADFPFLVAGGSIFDYADGLFRKKYTTAFGKSAGGEGTLQSLRLRPPSHTRPLPGMWRV